MKSDGLSHYRTGILIPVAAIVSDQNLGVGEFADLPALSRWCVETGLDLIQLLPVNDSGTESSPYSALSAFALHPLYLRIADLPEYLDLNPPDKRQADRLLDEICANHRGNERIKYGELLNAKLNVVEFVFDRANPAEKLSAQLDAFVADNPWVKAYSVFKNLKRLNELRSWLEWPAMQDPLPEDLDAAWNDPEMSHERSFVTWLQMRLHEQLRDAATKVHNDGVMLKGDLPILMNDDSVDVWAHRNYFMMHLRAGAPPDMFSHLGQNWGLPVYDWDRMAQDGYRWWKDRLSHAARFYSAYRIDHVLGFFRVWAIPEREDSGLLGHFHPSKAATADDLQKIGFDDGRIRWLAEPHLPGSEIRDRFPEQHREIISACLEQIGDEDLYLFGPDIQGEKDITGLDLEDDVRNWLLACYADRALISLGTDYAPAWSFRSCSRYQQLGDGEKGAFEALVERLGDESEGIWDKQARTLLGFMTQSTDMLTCAEDLGVIPRVVPAVLNDLNMLGLRIPRWARLWDQPGQPYIPAADFPFLSVCAPSVHDTSTMRGWWCEDESIDQFWVSLGLEGDPPETYSPEVAQQVTEALLHAGSAICVFPVQDILSLSNGVPHPQPEDERVNVPGTVNDFNWNYRMPISVEQLSENEDLKSILKPMVGRRRERPVKRGE